MALDTGTLTVSLESMGFTSSVASEFANALAHFVQSGTVLPGTFANTGGPVVGVGSIL